MNKDNYIPGIGSHVTVLVAGLRKRFVNESETKSREITLRDNPKQIAFFGKSRFKSNLLTLSADILENDYNCGNIKRDSLGYFLSNSCNKELVSNWKYAGQSIIDIMHPINLGDRKQNFIYFRIIHFIFIVFLFNSRLCPL